MNQPKVTRFQYCLRKIPNLTTIGILPINFLQSRISSQLKLRCQFIHQQRRHKTTLFKSIKMQYLAYIHSDTQKVTQTESNNGDDNSVALETLTD
jgi:hypothetical protein